MDIKIVAIGIIGVFILAGFPQISALKINSGNTIYVDDSGGADYTKIQDAVDAASDGDTIFVYPGVYNENVIIDKQIELIGANRDSTIIDGGNRNKDVLFIAADDVTVRNFTVRNSGECWPDGGGAAGIEIDQHRTQNNIIDCTAYNCEYGFQVLEKASHNSFVNCDAYDCDTTGFSARNGCSYQIIRECEFYENGVYGIVLYSDGSDNYEEQNNHNIIKDCYLYGNDNSGIAFSGKNNLIDGCIIFSSWFGISCVSYSENNTITNCEITKCYDVGILVDICSRNNEILNCNIYKNQYGITFDIAIKSSKVPPSKNNKILYNNFGYNTKEQAWCGEGCINIWDDGSKGNYWSDYSGEDSNGDGIGDSPYDIYTKDGGINQDRFPVISPYGNKGPAAPVIKGPTSGKAGTEYSYTFCSEDPEINNIYYLIDWGDGEVTDWIGPYSSGEEITLQHTWGAEGMYTIRAKAKDIYGVESDWGTLKVSMPRSKPIIKPLFLQFLDKIIERFPLITQLLKLPALY